MATSDRLCWWQAYRLYRQHPLAVLSYSALFTRDADVALGDKDKFDGNIKDALTKAGFHEDLESEFKPLVSKYTLGKEEQAGFYAEFLTTLLLFGRELRPQFRQMPASGLQIRSLRPKPCVGRGVGLPLGSQIPQHMPRVNGNAREPPGAARQGRAGVRVP